MQVLKTVTRPKTAQICGLLSLFAKSGSHVQSLQRQKLSPKKLVIYPLKASARRRSTFFFFFGKCFIFHFGLWQLFAYVNFPKGYCICVCMCAFRIPGSVCPFNLCRNCFLFQRSWTIPLQGALCKSQRSQ